jgi:hypothetical protein
MNVLALLLLLADRWGEGLLTGVEGADDSSESVRNAD